MLIVVEIKYLSGTSDWNNDQKAGNLDLTGRQLADKVRGLHDMSTSILMRWFYIPDKAGNQEMVKAHLWGLGYFSEGE